MAASFPSPESKLVFEKSSFLHEKSRHNKIIKDRYFNHQVQIDLPGCEQLPPEFSKFNIEQEYWIVHNLPVKCLINKEFIEAFVKKGRMYMLSLGTNIDTANCIALLPTGELILNVNKDTYEELGLEGQASQFSGKTPQKYVVKIDMMPPYFTPSKKNYERIKWCLTERLNLDMDYLFTWVPYDDEISSKSIAAYFERYQYKTTEYILMKNTSVTLDLNCPTIDSRNIKDSYDQCGYREFWEWLGAIALGVDWEYVKYSSSKCPWVAVTVHGFHDSPVTWRLQEHGYHISGDNIYTFVIFPNQDYWLYTALDKNDILC